MSNTFGILFCNCQVHDTPSTPKPSQGIRTLNVDPDHNFQETYPGREDVSEWIYKFDM